MNESSITQFITDTFEGVDVVVASRESGAPEVSWGDIFFFYDPDQNLATDRRFPFSTVVTKDYPGFDSASNLNRPGVFRLNIGISRETFRALFDGKTSSFEADDGVKSNYDFTALDQLMPHPVYGKMFWVCALNPSAATFETIKPLLAEAYDRAAKKN
jgi:hypothetical protein